MAMRNHSLEALIRAAPDDGDAWDVYGDWLLEIGDPRGELLRLERLAEQTDDPALAQELAGQIAQLVAQHQVDWEADGAPRETTYAWRHGFISEIALHDVYSPYDIEWLLLFLTEPAARFVTGVALRFSEQPRPDCFAPLDSLSFAHLRHFEAAYHNRGDDLARLVASRSQLALTSLDLRYSALTDDGLTELAHCRGLSGLRALTVHKNQIGRRGVESLATSPALTGLETLDLRFNAIGAAGARAIASSSALRTLTTLRVYPDDIEADGMRALASSTTLQRPLVRYWRAREQAS